VVKKQVSVIYYVERDRSQPWRLRFLSDAPEPFANNRWDRPKSAPIDEMLEQSQAGGL
jgi:hypothetical protein